MKFSHAWLQQYVPIDEPPERVGARLTAVGIPLDGLESVAGDTLYDFDISTNRPDCMNHLGLAREYAALAGAPLKRPAATATGGGPATGEAVRIDIEAPDLCSRYSARLVTGVQVGASPDWLVRRLESIGQRSINNVVDITNFVLWELGHPLHAFDRERIGGGRVVVRRARAGERIATLDGIDRPLGTDDLVIADARQAIAVAGVMGGVATEISAATRDILLESAWFEPATVRRTARALGLRTDASHRFERGADPGITLRALDRAARLIAETAGGRISDPPLDVEPRPQPPRQVSFRPARARALLDLKIEDSAMKRTLERLEFEVAPGGAPATGATGDVWRVTVPTFRRDVDREADLIEEIARHHGYDAIPAILPVLPDAGGGRSESDEKAAAVRRCLQGSGLSEAINYVMVDETDCALFSPDVAQPLALENPLQSQSSHLRTSLLPGLLRNLAHNLNHGQPGCHLYEIGATFRPGDGMPEERTRVAFVLAGRGLPVHWSLPRRDVDLYDARGAVELLGDMLGISSLRLTSDKIPFLARGRAMRCASQEGDIGVLGEFTLAVRERYAIERPVFGGELDLEALLRAAPGELAYRALPRHPSVRRDLALVLARGVTFASVEEVIRASAGLPVTEIQVFDHYRGPGVPDGCLSLAVQVVFQHPERTLAAEEVQKAQDEIVAALDRDLGVRLRGAARS